MPEVSERPELIHLDVDRRLGHEWDEWNGQPLPNQGSFDASPRLFFAWSGLWIAGATALAAGLLLLLAPRLALLASALPTILGWGIGVLAALVLLWWVLLVISYSARVPLLPERLAERGPLLPLMRWTSRLADRFGRRDWVENAAIKVYDAMALARKRKVSRGELLLLIPRCLAKDILEGVLRVAGRYQIPVFVATRGQLARRVIQERRPRAVVAVACERDMVSGLHDVAGKVPVLGLTLTLPNGPCRDTRVDLALLEEWVKAYVV
jgi:uncharacterized protein